MSDLPILILLIEDNCGDARLIQEMLREAGHLSYHLWPADRLATGLARLTEGGIDVVLLDLSLPDSSGLDTLMQVHTQAPRVPIVILTGQDDEGLAIQALRKGAQDYLVKGRVDSHLLARAIRYAIERKYTEEELQRSHDELERRVEERTAELRHANELRLRFMGMISHELRTPLTSIKGFTTTLLAEDVAWDAQSQREFLTIIDQEADKLTDMISQLLDLSRIESGTLRVDPSAQSLASILEAARLPLEALAAAHSLRVAVPADLPPVRADAQRIEQVLTNLVGNAAKYAPLGTPITVTALHEAAVSGDFVRVSVIDAGPGIAPADRPYVFEAFRRGSDGKTRQTKGAGLGLAICKGLVEAHGGSIWIEERAGPGTTISFTLPLAGGD